MFRTAQILKSLAIAGSLALLLWVGIVSADPANATLSILASNLTPYVGERITITYRIDTMDAAEAFSTWQVRLGYNPDMMEYAGCTINSALWATGAPAGTACIDDAVNHNVQIGEGNFGGQSTTSTPFILGTVSFTVTASGISNFEIITDDAQIDTTFQYPGMFPPFTYWQPGTINVQQINAGDYVWHGALNTNWDNSNNWIPSTGLPGSSHAVIIPGNVTWYPILNTNASVYTLTIQSGAALTIPLNYALTAEGAVANDGRLTIEKTAGDGVPTEFHLKNQAGDAVTYYGAVITPTGSMGTTRVQIKGHQECTTQDEPGDTVNRCYDITPGATPTSAALRLYYLADELDGQTPSNMAVWHWNNGTTTWALAGSSTPGGSDPHYYVDVTNVTAFSPFVLKDSDTVAPTAISLVGLAAYPGGLWPAGALFFGAVGILAARKRRP